MGIAGWLTIHWLDLLQSIAIVGGLLFSAHSVGEAARAQRVQNIFSLTNAHRDLWSNVFKYPRLARVLQPDADPKNVSEDEEIFVQMLILHLRTWFKAGQTGMAFPEEGLRDDIKEFLKLPIPKFVWDKTKAFQDSDFVEFVESVS